MQQSTHAPNILNPHTILSQVPSDSKWFSVVDLEMHFSVSQWIKSQFWFAFLFESQMYTFSRLCQGYTESPTIFNAALKDNLNSLNLPVGSIFFLQYVDDLMICSLTQEACVQDTLALLNHLADNGHKASLSKLQFVFKTSHFSGSCDYSRGKNPLTQTN